ncbi:MAG TPA: hypothetical protein DCR04_06625 [Flavobacteriales bacterium]|nr:hypothetical protein [Flavobacteriales bacterium]
MENKARTYKKLGYWTITALLTAMLAFSGIGALLKFDFLIEAMSNLGFPLSVMNILGTAYVLAAVAIAAPGFPKLKEWAHAGVFFAMSGGLASHLMNGDSFEETAGSLILMSLNIGSYLLRPDNRRFTTLKGKLEGSYPKLRKESGFPLSLFLTNG